MLCLASMIIFAVSPMLLAEHRESSTGAANPIRKVVTMLQGMQRKVGEEGKKEKELYDKFMCYCKKGKDDLVKSIENAKFKKPTLVADIKKAEEQRAMANGDYSAAQKDRTAAQGAMDKATGIREKEAGEFAVEKAEGEATIVSIIKAMKAIKSLEQGMAGTAASFLQTEDAQAIRQLLQRQLSSLMDEDRDLLLSFLSSKETSEYVPQSGQIVGILKQIMDELKKNLEDATGIELHSIEDYEHLMKAKGKEVRVLLGRIERDNIKLGELSVAIEQMKASLTDSDSSLIADKAFLASLEEGCSTKEAEWDERVKTRAAEMLALSDTIKILNDDDALDLFKKTLPGTSSSFVQFQSSSSALRSTAAAALVHLQGVSSTDKVKLNLLLLALRGKKVGFEKIIQMINEMVATLKKEQVDDDHKKEFCNKQLDFAEDKTKDLEHNMVDAQNEIQSAKEGIAALKEELEALTEGIKELDKEVTEATVQRKSENEEYREVLASHSAAKELLSFAKNRLYKFYNPKLYQPPSEAASEAFFAQVKQHMQGAIPPPPDTYGVYSKKTSESTGVISMINLLIKDLETEIVEAEKEEEGSQKQYEGLMRQSAEKRVADSRLITEKQATAADLRSDLEKHKDEEHSAKGELAATLKYLSSLHVECDFLLQYFDVRKEARSSESEALKQAKAVLNGADMALLQRSKTRSLRGSV